MPQVYYQRLLPSWILLIEALIFIAILIAVAVTQGVTSQAVWIVIFVQFLVQSLLTILDPGTTIESLKKMDDGSVVKVRRPIIGFRKCERIVGSTGGYEVRIDGFRYEEAYIRL